MFSTFTLCTTQRQPVLYDKYAYELTFRAGLVYMGWSVNIRVPQSGSASRQYLICLKKQTIANLVIDIFSKNTVNR